jgi:hypothetical protein
VKQQRDSKPLASNGGGLTKVNGILTNPSGEPRKSTRLLEGARREIFPDSMAERGIEEQERTRITATSASPFVWKTRITLCKIPSQVRMSL